MPIDPTKLTNLLALSLTGKPAVCAYWVVEWDPDDAAQTRYYSDAAYNQTPPFLNVGVNIEARILGNVIRDTQFEINPDLRTETIPLAFNDIDKAISTKFQTFKSGIRIELFYYYPDVDLTVSLWYGQLQAPQIYGHKTLQTVASNGFRSREQLIPKRMRPRECTANFGGRLPTTEAVRTNLCPYDRHVGGVTGLLNGAVPFTDCPRLDASDCTARFGHARYFGGFNTDASATVTDTRSGYVAVSKGNESALKVPIRWVFGQKYLRGLQLLLWRREVNNQNPDHGWVRGIWEVCEGPVVSISNIKVIEKIIEYSQQVIRLGQRGQPSTGYATTVGNFSSTALFLAAYGWVNPLEISAGQLTAECNVTGFREVAVYDNFAAGNGLIGEYTALVEGWSSIVVRRVDATVNFASGTTAPVPGAPENGFTVVWTGQIKPLYTETYTISAIHDDGVVVVINSVTVINEAAAGTHSGTIALTADTLYDIQITLTQSTTAPPNPWSMVLRWQSASQALEVVPTGRLFHAVGQSVTRQWTDDRVWALLEIYTNQKAGMANPVSRFTLADYMTASKWTRDTVSFTLNGVDGETDVYSGRRSIFDASLEPRPVYEQVEDVCRSGALSVPFQHEGAYTISTFRPATAGELTAARVFTDTGSTKNIVWAEGQPSIYLSQVPDDKIVNEITLTFEEQSNKDVERPIKVDDPDQKLRAGRVLGEENLQDVPRRDPAFGCRYLQEVIRLGYRKLRFGDFDEGGIQNNLRAVFTVPFEQVLGLKRYEIVKLVSTLLDQFTIGTDNGVDDWTETPQYFRILKMRKIDNGRCEITAQAYNHTAYTAFETVTATGTGTPANLPGSGGSPTPPPPEPPVCPFTFSPAPTYDQTTGVLSIPVPPC